MRVQVLLQSWAKSLISDSWGASEAGRGCWAFPFWKSPKFMALGLLVLCTIEMGSIGSCGGILFEVTSLICGSVMVQYSMLGRATYSLVLGVQSLGVHTRPASVL